MFLIKDCSEDDDEEEEDGTVTLSDVSMATHASWLSNSASSSTAIMPSSSSTPAESSRRKWLELSGAAVLETYLMRMLVVRAGSDAMKTAAMMSVLDE